jgi:GDPmannose 4,6-dehydratase
VRQEPSATFPNLEDVRDRVELLPADLLDEASLVAVLEACEPHEVYNLASPSFVPLSWEQPVVTAEFAAVGVTAMLEAIRRVDGTIRFYQASSSEIFGDPVEAPQTEETRIAPVTPYGIAKAYAHFITQAYRRQYGIYACSGILYNHESPRRPAGFLPRKVAQGAARIAAGFDHELVLGDLDARRDWGYAGDYVTAMRLMLRQAGPDDFVIASGKTHSVRELVEVAFAHVGLDWRTHVRSDPALVRGSAELHNLVGAPAKAHELLGWRPTVSFEALVRLLVDADLERIGESSRSSADRIL